MNFTPKPGFGALFKNDKKDGHAQRPDYKGSLCLPDGSTVQIGGWIMVGENGPYLSLRANAPLPPTSTEGAE